MGFPPFSSVPNVDKFNEETGKNFTYKSLLFLASIIPRESDGSIDWKGLDFTTYIITVIKPMAKEWKFKLSFATQENYQKLTHRLKEEINPLLSSLCSQFSSLSSVSELNNLTETYLSKIFVGYVYSEIQDSLAEQLEITNHEKFRPEKTGNTSENYSWKIALNEFAFEGGNSPEPNPNPSNNEYQLLTNDLQYIHDKFTVINNREQGNDPNLKDWFSSKWKAFWMLCEDAKNGLPKIEQLQAELSSHTNDKDWIKQTRNYIHNKHDWLFKKFKNKEETEVFCDLPANEQRFQYISKVWQNK